MPQLTAALPPAAAGVAVLNRSIPGQRLRLDAPVSQAARGRSGLSRLDDVVLETPGLTHVVLAYGSNDVGLPGGSVALSELPTAGQLIKGSQALIDRAGTAHVGVILATITPMSPSQSADASRERIRQTVNHWMRTSGLACVDFDAAIRSDSVPACLAPAYDAGAQQHPNVAGERRLAQTMTETIVRVG